MELFVVNLLQIRDLAAERLSNMRDSPNEWD
jgi:hypothetical protein